MKFRLLALAAALAWAGGAQAGGDHDHSARHGGVVVSSKAYDFEVVAKPEVIQVYVGEHGKPVKLEGAKGKVTLLNGSQKTEVDLAPAGDHMEAKGSFKVTKGTKGVATVTVAGRAASSVRFEVK